MPWRKPPIAGQKYRPYKSGSTLGQMSSNCAECHQNDLEEKFRGYASQLGINDPAVINQALQTAVSAANTRPAFLPLDPLSIPLPGSTKLREMPETSTMVLPLTRRICKHGHDACLFHPDRRWGKLCSLE